MTHDNDIKQLLDRYMSGDTSNEEEARLRAFFAACGETGSGSLPAGWAVYKALFAYVDAERAAATVSGQADSSTPAIVPASGSTAKTPGAVSSAPMTVISVPGAVIRLLLTAAACVAAVVAGVLICLPAEPDNYAVIDGQVSTSPTVIEAEAMAALQSITLETDDDAFSALEMMP